MSEPNDALRAARESIESLASPGHPLTRQELAEALNAQVYRSTEKITAIDANHIGKWERGVITWPAAHYRAALRAVLDIATDADLGLENRVAGVPLRTWTARRFYEALLAWVPVSR
ncbi:hypothetical protein [Saccharopolyspora phatthalungensis]|uniref:Transcriptional regulator with XRE-family HTH domain n=1 Tax=Saccharopolyspora phatthalungensis TaxID=664693 RepID=A0A840QF79_9PSEU|nr:hypothetical protein [Saccharopolyspora phatthalungensis]MBB5158717.1 transcriptional regulator with XRE-family HTH domain [Saccharopolyspora phatthalungensis]